MTPEIQQQLIDWLKNLGNLATEELPTFVQEIATYGFYSNIVVASTCLIICILGMIAMFTIWKFINLNREEKLTVIACAVFLLIPIAQFTKSVSEAIKAKCAPRLYAIERITNK